MGIPFVPNSNLNVNAVPFVVAKKRIVPRLAGNKRKRNIDEMEAEDDAKVNANQPPPSKRYRATRTNLTSNAEVAEPISVSQPIQPKRQLAPKPIGLPLMNSQPMSAVDVSSNKNDEEVEEKNDVDNVIKNENANMAPPLESAVSNVNVADIQQDDRDSTPMTDVDEESQSEVELDLEEDEENANDDDDDEEGTTDEEDEYSDSNDENEDEYEDEEEEEDDDREDDDEEGGEGMIDLCSSDEG